MTLFQYAPENAKTEKNNSAIFSMIHHRDL